MFGAFEIMFTITTKDQDLFKEIEEMYPEEDLELFSQVNFISIDKKVGWYYVILHTDEGEQPYLKSTCLPIMQVKRVKYYSNCAKVFVCESIVNEIHQMHKDLEKVRDCSCGCNND